MFSNAPNSPLGERFAAKLPTKAAAEFLGVSPRSLEKWRTTGGGPRFLKIGSRVVYDVDDLGAFLAQCRRTSTSDPGRPEGDHGRA